MTEDEAFEQSYNKVDIPLSPESIKKKVAHILDKDNETLFWDNKVLKSSDPLPTKPSKIPNQYSHMQFAELLDKTIHQIKELSKHKGGEYAGDNDRLANFRRNAKNLNLNMETIWAVYASKHWDAIIQYIADLNSGVDRTRLEPLPGRLDDLIVYCILFKAMLEEREAK